MSAVPACNDCAWCKPNTDGLCHHPASQIDTYAWDTGVDTVTYHSFADMRTSDSCGERAALFHPLDAIGVQIRNNIT